MAIDSLARGMAANASGGGGGGVDVDITPGVGIRFDGTDPVEIINTGVTAVTTPGSSGADADAPLGSVKVSNPGAENSADRVHYIVPKGLNVAAFKDVDTEINSSVATSTKLPTTKAVYDELVKKVEATIDKTAFTTTDDAHIPTSKLVKEKLDDKLDTTTTINGVSVSNGEYTLDGDDIDLTGYTPISSGTEEDVAATDSVNDAVAKIEYKADNRIPTDNIDTDFPVSPDADHVLASTVASATFQGTGTVGVAPKKGLVPAPSTTSGTETRYLKADGTWDTPPNSEYSEGTGIDISNAGVISNTGVTHIENSDPADDNVGNGTFKVTENGTDKWIAIKGLDDAAYKDVDVDTISDTTSTAKLPTDKAVAAYVSANYIPLTQKGTNSGVAELDASGKVLASQLPSFVDDVIDGFLYSDTFYTETPQQPINEVVPGYYYNDAFYEDSAHTELITGVEGKLYLDITSSIIAGYRYNETDTEYVSTTITAISTPETGKIYTDISTNKSYRWGGSAWSLVASDLALGETATTAYRGDRGKIAYDHSQTAHAPSNAEANVLEAVKINGVAQTISNKAIDITADTTPTDGSDNLITSDAVYDALTDKVDKEAGKGLSTNDLTDNLKNSYDSAVTHAGTTSGNPHNVSKSDVGLENVTNNAQVKAVSSAVTSGGIVTFGADGATVADSAKTIETTLTSNSDTKIPTSKAVADHVTSAIGGLDVSEVSVGSNETISKISETDGKISVTKQTIRSATTSQTGIVQLSDSLSSTSTALAATANAVKTVNDKADTNQSNILYGLNTGVKNELVIKEAQATSYTQGVTFTLNDDQSITINATSTHPTVWIYINQDYRSEMIDKFKNREMVISGMPTNSPVQLRMWHYDGTNTAIGDGTSNGEFTLTVSDPTSFAVDIVIPENTAVSNVTVRPMICTKAAWDQSHDYMPPALPNYDLTRLESEDRAGLIECVDCGAKNLLNTPTVTISNITWTVDSNSYITASPNNSDPRLYSYSNRQYTVHLKPGSYVLALDIKTATAGNSANVSLLNTSDTTVANIINTQISGKTGIVYSEFTITTDGDYGIIAKVYDMVARLMICTKAAFGVSNKFVPYRPNYDLVVKRTELVTLTSETGSFANALPTAMNSKGYTDYSTRFVSYIASIYTMNSKENILLYGLYQYNVLHNCYVISHEGIEYVAVNNIGTISVNSGTGTYIMKLKLLI